MLAGHFGLAAAVKSREGQAPLWALMIATQLMDIVFVVLVAFGIESYGPMPGTNGGYAQTSINALYSHSLVGALALSIVAALITMIPWGRRTGIVIGLVVFSHWVLDLIVHRPDLAILPGNAGNLPLIGLGLWNFMWVSAALELLICLVGAYLYYHAAMRTAVVAERQDAKAGATPKGYRQQALTASIVMLVLLVGTLAADVVGL